MEYNLLDPAQLPSAAGRARQPRSRKDRPCDTCRRLKHSCVIQRKGDPCVACAVKGKPCLFELPPTTRVRKVKEDESASGSSTPSTSRAPPPSTLLARPPFAAPAALALGVDSAFVADLAFAASTSSNPPSSAEPTLFQLLRTIRLHEDDLASVPIDPQDEAVSLDNEVTEESEVHYTAPTAFADLTLCDAGPCQRRTDPPCVSYRKVGDSGIFTRHPSRVYGHGAVKDGKECFEQVEKMVGPERMDELLETFFAKTLPAFPIFSAARLRSAYAARGSNPSDPTPYSVFSAIIPHVSTYIVDIRQLHKAAWGLCLDDMDDQYRQSRLNVVQLAVLLLVSRPALNTGQGTIATARAIGAAQLLGMHMDPSAWKLPAWERSVRKRLFWALLIHDKFRALLFGRPSNLHSSTYNVPIPTMADADADSTDPVEAMQSFIALCRLTKLLDTVLTEFYSVQGPLHPSRSSRLLILEGINADLDAFAQSLPPALQLRHAAHDAPLVTGVCSFQLSHLGIQVILMRLTLECIDATQQWQLLAALRAAYKTAEGAVVFCESLLEGDLNNFWIPYSASHLSNAAALILRIAIRAIGLDESLRAACVALFDRLLTALRAHWPLAAWDVSSAALERTRTLVISAGDLLPEVKGLLEKCTVDGERGAYGTTASPPDFSSLGEMLLDNSDPYWWINGSGMTGLEGFPFTGVDMMGMDSFTPGMSGVGGFL